MATVRRRVVGTDRYSWATDEPGRKLKARNSAARGEVIEVSAEESARGEGLGFLADPDTPDTAPEPVETEPDEWTPAHDIEIEQMTVEGVVAYLGQVPQEYHESELARVVEIENGRDRPRVGVLSLAPDFEPDPDDLDDTLS